MSLNCEVCGSSAVYRHEEEFGITIDCQTCGHWTFEKYDWVDEKDLSDNLCLCKFCLEVIQ